MFCFFNLGEFVKWKNDAEFKEIICGVTRLAY